MQDEMSLVEHLTELRKRLIIVACTFIVTVCAGLYFAPQVLNWLKNQPSAQNIAWNVFGFTDGFMIYFKCALLVSLLFTLPVLLYQVWAFLKPGLSKEEAKGTLLYVPVSFLLFLVGASFSYFVVAPLVVGFMSSINESIGATETYGINQYFTFLFNIVFPISIVFEMPVVVLFLTKMGILNPQKLRKMRKLAYFVLVVVGVSLTPPDFISDVLIIVPLLLLFEASILCSSWSIKKKEKRMLHSDTE